MKLSTSSLSIFCLLAALGTSAPTPGQSKEDELLNIHVFQDRTLKLGSLPAFITLPSADSQSQYYVLFKARLPSASEDEDLLTDWVLLSAQYSQKGAQLLNNNDLYLAHAFIDGRKWKTEARIFRGRHAANLISRVISYKPILYSVEPIAPSLGNVVPAVGLPDDEVDGKLAWTENAVDFMLKQMT